MKHGTTHAAVTSTAVILTTHAAVISAAAIFLLCAACSSSGAAPAIAGSGGPDSGGPDAGSSDSGSPDSGSPDSGSPDSGSPDSGSPDSGSPDSGSPDSGSPDSGSPADGGCVSSDAGAEGTCIGSALLGGLGKTDLMIGATMQDASAAAGRWDVRYIYISGGLNDGPAPCASCATSCTAQGHSCANASGGCAWWGCYQYDVPPPGLYVSDFVANNKAAVRIPMFTWYQLLQSMSAPAEGSAEVAAANDATLMARYWNDYRFFLQQIRTGTDPHFVSESALLQIEPDFWGYAEQVGANPHAIPAKVAAANPTDCACFEDSIAGLGRCFISMARKYAPHVRVGLHGSAWATGVDVSLNTDPALNVAGEAGKLAAFLAQAGGGDGDFITVDASDRDAGYYHSLGRSTFWDATNATLPSFHQHFAWAKALAEGVHRPILYWQVPVGNMSLPDANNQWRDNRVDYFFAHTDELVAAHVAGIFFGAGASGMTTPETDGNNLLNKLHAYTAAGGTPVCR